MYHCTTLFYLYGLDNSFEQIITSMNPGENFSFLFSCGKTLEETELETADVIFADLHGTDFPEMVRKLAHQKKPDAQWILFAGQEEADALFRQTEYMPDDIWRLPLSEEELSFHLARWQKNYILDKDYREVSHFLDVTINSVPDLIWFKDKNGAHIKVNDSFCQAVGKTKEQVQGRGHYYIWDIEPEEYANGEYICMESEFEVMEKRHTCVFAEKVKVGDEIRQFETYKSPLFDFDGSVMGTVGIANDVTQERLYQQMIIDSANTDFLTGLYNRRYVYQYMELQYKKALTVYYLDLDNFKSVNDRYGHQAGDNALILTKDVLKKCMPDTVIARIGGDEFLVVQEGARSAEDIEKTKNHIEQMLVDAYQTREEFHAISASIGTAYSPAGEITVLDSLIEQADSLMYQEKRTKKSNASHKS